MGPLYLALALLFTACGGGEPARPSPLPTATAVPWPTGTQAITIVLLGETARSDTEEITVHAFRRSSVEHGETAIEGHEWLLLDVEVRNLADAPLPFNVQLFHADGREFARAYPPSASEAMSDAISAWSEVRGEIAFLVEQGSTAGVFVFGLGETLWAVQLTNGPRQ
jgi:hypothetical protein